MLPQKLLHVVKSSRNIISHSANPLPLLTCVRNFQKTNYNAIFSQQKTIKEKRTLKPWRQSHQIDVPEIVKFVSPVHKLFNLFRLKFNPTPWDMEEYYEQRIIAEHLEAQRYSEDMVKQLGPDLALSFIVIASGGKVKFKGNEHYIDSKDPIIKNYPGSFDPNYIITGIDISDIIMFYEGLQYLANVGKLKDIICRNGYLFDDWHLDRVTALCPNLEYLDISQCAMLSERGLVAIYKLSNLKTLIVTDYGRTSAFELTCYMLQDLNPELKIEVRQPIKEIEEVKK